MKFSHLSQWRFYARITSFVRYQLFAINFPSNGRSRITRNEAYKKSLRLFAYKCVLWAISNTRWSYNIFSFSLMQLPRNTFWSKANTSSKYDLLAKQVIHMANFHILYSRFFAKESFLKVRWAKLLYFLPSYWFD